MLIQRLLTYSLLSLIALGGFFGNLQIDMGTQIESRIAISYVGNGVYAFNGPCPSWQIAWTSSCIDDPSIGWFGTDADITTNQKAAGITPDTAKPANQSAEFQKMLQSLVNGLNIFLWLLTAIVSPAIMLAGWLMSPDWTSGDLFGLREPMYRLWVTVSNIVYFVYAVMLILIALGTMFGQEKFSYKVMLPKLALGILMVPFTWWFVQWTISISSVVTASVITIPAETMASLDTDKKWWMSIPSIPKEITIDERSTKSPDATKIWCGENGANCIAPIDVINKASGMYGYMMVYAYSVFKFQEVREIKTFTDGVASLADIVHQWLVASLMFIVFWLLTLALVSILLVRAIKLWAYAIFAPLFTFQFVAGSVGTDKDMFSIKEFIGLCFVPVVVGLTLSFGLIMISAVSSGKAMSGWKECTKAMIEGDGCTLITIAGNDANTISRRIDTSSGRTTVNTIKFGGITTIMKGKAGAAKDAAVEAGSASTVMSVLNSAWGILGTLIVDIIALVFIWLAFMAAKNVSKAVAGAIEPFEKIGSQVGNLAKSLPKYTPLPIPGGSVAGLWMTADLAKSKFETAMRAKEEKSIGKMFPGLVEWLIKAEDMAKLEKTMKDNNGTTSTNMSNIAKAMGDAANKWNADKNIEAFWDRVKWSMNEERIKALFTDKRITDKKDQEILSAILSGKSNTLNSTEKETWWKKIQSWGTGGGDEASKASGYTTTSVPVANWKQARTSINMEWVTFQIDADGKNMETISQEKLKTIQDKIKMMTKEEFEDKLWSVNTEVKKAIIATIGKDVTWAAKDK
jgi:hypothetical protein